MKLYDATLPIREGMATFPGDPPFRRDPVFDIGRGDPFNLALLSMGTHLGTHVDPPAHYLPGGATVDELPLDALMGPGIVLDMRGRERIDRKALADSRLGDARRVLFKTDNGPLLLGEQFREDYVSLTGDGAEFLVVRGILLAGIDYLSIEAYQNPGAPVHRILLDSGVVVVEGVNLMEVPPGPYEIFCLPLKIQGGDGAPARVVLRG
jgi:arylformamidase